MTGYPNLITIGAMKAGTTLLHDMLGRHADIHASRVKEPNFFAELPEDRDRDWYCSLFNKESRYNLESSVSYSRAPRAPWLVDDMLALCPDVRIIYLVREPINRIVSQYAEAVDQFYEYRDIERYILEVDHNEECPLQTSMYYSQIERYLSRLSADRIHVIVFEEFIKAPAESLDRLGRFLNLTDLPRLAASMRVVNSRDIKRAQNPVGRLLASRPLTRPLLTENVLPWPARRALAYVSRVGAGGVESGPLDPSLVDRLVDRLAQDVGRLEGFIGRPIASWRRFH